MTTRPRLRVGSHLLPGLVAVGLFAVLAYVFLTAPFGDPAGFAEDANITANIGYAMFDLFELQTVDSEGFLVAFIAIAVVLDAALEGALLLARREKEGELLAAIGQRRGDR